MNLRAGNCAFATQSWRKCHKSGNLAVSEVCLYETRVPVPNPIGLMVPRHALICHFRVSRWSLDPGWHIFRLKMCVIWVRVHILHGSGKRGSFWPGNVWDNRLSGPVWPLIWQDGYSTNNNRLLAHILSYLLIPDILAKSRGERGRGGKTPKSRNRTFSSISQK